MYTICNKAAGHLEPPPISGFLVYSNLLIFFWCSHLSHNFNTPTFRPSTTGCLRYSGSLRIVLHPQRLVIIFRLAFRTFSTEVYASTLACCSARKSSKFRRYKIRQKNTPATEHLHLTGGQLHLITRQSAIITHHSSLLTSNHSPRN